ncbi:MAG: VWA domain-containing protein [Patescibacteria group bacterium]|nr:VWA domain-containing protein [Patescibacteria group bacterium]
MNTPATEFAFDNPAWLAAVVLLPLVWGLSQRSLAHLTRGRRVASLVVRCLLVALLVAGLAGPRLRRATRDVFVVVAHDVSRSIVGQGEDASRLFREDMRRLAGRVPVRYLAFPAEPGRDGTDLAAAILAARAMMPADFVPRIVLLTDGNATAGDTLAAVASAGCAIDVVPLNSPEHEVYVAAVETPGAIRQGEVFFADVLVHALHGDAGQLTLRIDDAEPVVREVTLAPGQNRFRFRNLTGPGPTVRLTANIDGCRDTVAENNGAGAIVCLQPLPRVLLVDSQPRLAEALNEALEASGAVQVTLGPPESLPSEFAPLLEYDLVIVSNVPAAGFSKRQLESLQRYVHDAGGGLIVVGGNRAFTAGDYGGTSIEAMLPVAVFEKPDKPRPTLAMLLVLDRSGSMQGAPIELARQAARQAVAKLGPRDQVGIIAFEDRVHWVVPLQPLTDPESVLKRIDAITAGGGTNIAPALDQAHLALRNAVADRKHVILLSDGISHPADFDVLARRIAEDGVSISTVGVGGEASEQFLRTIAELAAGHAYFCVDPSEMPSIFEADVMAAA